MMMAAADHSWISCQSALTAAHSSSDIPFLPLEQEYETWEGCQNGRPEQFPVQGIEEKGNIK